MVVRACFQSDSFSPDQSVYVHVHDAILLSFSLFAYTRVYSKTWFAANVLQSANIFCSDIYGDEKGELCADYGFA